MKRRALSKPAIVLAVIVLAAPAAATWLLHSSAALRTEARDRFFDQYNHQQLLLAQQAAHTIEELFATLRRDLSLVVSLFDQGEVTVQRAQEVGASLRKAYEVLSDTPVIDLVVFDREGTVVAIVPSDEYTLGRSYDWRDYYQWARDLGEPGQMYLSPFTRMEGGQSRGAKALIVAEGIYGEDGRFQGLATFTVNFDALARKHVLSIRLGEHGYAWLFDANNRTVLVDPDGRVSGRDLDGSFQARWPRLHAITLRAESGEPGVDWYEYEDPADPAKTVRKLVGYAPVRIESRLWTLGVCTPEREVEAVVADFLRRQTALSAVSVTALSLGAVVLLGLLLTWNRALSGEVAVRTRDLSDAQARLQSAFEELLLSKKLAALGRLAVGLVHEIRNPLSSIRMNLQMIRKKIQAQGVLQENFSIAEEEILRLNGLLNEVLDFARPRPLDLEAVDLRTQIDRVLLLTAQRLEQQQVRVRVTTNGELGGVVCDPEKIGQVLLNLVLNALDALEGATGPRELTLTGRRDGRWVELRVADSGPGVATEDREKLFDPFFTTKASGGGLGLSVAQSIVHSHRGTLGVDGAEEGGAVFTVRLPADGPGTVPEDAS